MATTNRKSFMQAVWEALGHEALRASLERRRCGAKTRKGTPCKVVAGTFRCKNGKWRCRYHGGLSTGPKTPEGKARCGQNLAHGHARRS